MVIANGTRSLYNSGRPSKLRSLKIAQAFPGILERQYPIVKGGYPLLTILYLLRMQDIDAVPISPVTKSRARAVFGLSSLPLFMNLAPERFAELLRGPCEAASDELSLLNVEDELDSLLEAFESKRLGFALVCDGGRVMRAGLVSLPDVLALYGRGSIKTSITIDQIGSPVFAMPGETTIHEALRTMFEKKQRRIFISGEGTYISDRTIMAYLFSPVFLEERGRGSTRDPLSTQIASVGRLSPAVVGPKTSLKAAAGKLAKDRGGCLITSDRERVVTPWDVVMKPWLSGKLVIP